MDGILHKDYNKYLVQGKYSTFQMDDFYSSFFKGKIKQSSVMNYMQHMYIAEKCMLGSKVLDLCCGRCLSIPLINNFAQGISKYVGIDISQTNLTEAKLMIEEIRDINFSIDLINGDITKLDLLVDEVFDVIIYTSAIEHMEKEDAIISISKAVDALSDKGVLYLSTPRTPKNYLNRVQYRCHIYEWDIDELSEILIKSGLHIIDCFGILSPSLDLFNTFVEGKFGKPGLEWFYGMKKRVPEYFLAPILATCFPEISNEVMFVCKKHCV